MASFSMFGSNGGSAPSTVTAAAPSGPAVERSSTADDSDNETNEQARLSTAAPSASSVVGAMAAAADKPGYKIRPKPVLEPKWSARDKAVRVIQQFLAENGLTATLSSLEAESKIKYDDDAVGASSVLLSAINRYEESLTEKKGERNLTDDYLRALGDSKEVCAKSIAAEIPLHVGNIIAVKFAPVIEGQAANILATGSVDQTVRFTNYATKTVVRTVDVKAPVLSLDWHPTQPSLLLAGCMNGSTHVINSAALGSAIVQSIKQHTKWVVAAKWNGDGTLFATASADQSLRIYRRDAAATNISTATYTSIYDVLYGGEVTAMEWIAATNSLLVCVRGDNYMHEISGTELKEVNKYNMNVKSWDDHVSFSVLDLVVSGDQKMVLACTDKSRIIMFEVGTPTQVRNFYGANNGEYANPRVAWSAAGKYIYVTTEDRQVAVFEVATAKLLSTTTASDKIVRGIAHHPSLPIVATVAYDRLVKLWTEDGTTIPGVPYIAPSTVASPATTS